MLIQSSPNNLKINYSPRKSSTPSIYFLALIFTFLVLSLVTVSYLNNLRDTEITINAKSANNSLTLSPLAYPVPIMLIPPAIINSYKKVFPAPPYKQWLAATIKPSDNITTIFSNLNLNIEQLDTILALPQATKPLESLMPGQEIHLQVDNQGKILQLVYPIAHNKTLLITSVNNQFIAHISNAPLLTHIKHIQGIIKGTLIDTLERTEIPEKVLYQLGNIFSWKMDSENETHEGDRFNILYQDLTLDSKEVQSGEILAAEVITNDGKKHDAIRYINQNHIANYYTRDGLNLNKSFLRFPLHFTRISSGFSLYGRYHPILHIFRPHVGIDLTAPIGTPIYAVGDGKIIYRGYHGGYGKVVIIDHGQGYTTLYAHLSRFADGENFASRVREGQVIGYVGMSGLTTGPHCHYEIRINGIHYDPLLAPLPQGQKLNPQELPLFLAIEQRLVQQLGT